MAALLPDIRGLEVSTVGLTDGQITALRNPSLGNWSYMVSSDGEAIVVDPQRDIEVYLALAAARGERIRHVVETHIHSDYLSGGRALADETRADVVASGLGKYEFAHRDVEDGDELELGSLYLSCVATPGHTFDHISWRVTARSDRAAAAAVLTGGSLLLGGAGRTDLASEAATPRLTALQYDSINRLAALPSQTLVLPTHGGGSACTVGDEEPVTEFRTVGEERVSNPFLTAGSLAAFDARLMGNRGPAPAYFPHVARLNRVGVPGNGRPAAPVVVAPADLARRLANGAAVVDARDRWVFAHAHIPDSLNIEPVDSFASNIGSTVPFGTPVALVIEERDRSIVSDLVAAAFRVGYQVDAVLDTGLDAWRTQGFAVESYPATDVLELIGEAAAGTLPAILDVRDPHEWAEGIIPGSVMMTVQALAHSAPTAPRGVDAARRFAPIDRCLPWRRAGIGCRELPGAPGHPGPRRPSRRHPRRAGGASGGRVMDPIAYPDMHAHSVEPLCAGPDAERLAESYITPTDIHFIRNHAPVPQLDTARHRVTIGGLVQRELSLSVDDLVEQFPRASVVATLQCAGNRRRELHRVRAFDKEILWGGEAVATAEWSGARLGDVLRHAGVEPSATHVWFEGVDSVAIARGAAPFGCAIGINRALLDDVLIAYEMNGAPLPPIHGAPFRLIVPGAIGARSVKWLKRIVVADRPSDSPFETDSYLLQMPGADTVGTPLTDMPLNSFICTPPDGSNVASGPSRFSGYATGAGVSPIVSVEISIDDGDWQSAELLDAPAPGAWVRWEFLAELDPGAHNVAVRATDATGTVQPPDVAARWNVRGYVNDAWHRIEVRAIAGPTVAGRENAQLVVVAE